MYVSLKDLHRDGPEELDRRSIVVLSDGNDTKSVLGFDDVKEQAQKSSVVIYAISLRASEEDLVKDKYRNAKYELDMLARESGGVSFAPEDIGDLSGRVRADCERAEESIQPWICVDQCRDGRCMATASSDLQSTGDGDPNPARILRPAPRPSIAPAPLVSPRRIRAFGLVVLIAFASCSRTRVPQNVLLVTIDTLRADRLGAYGNDSGLTPNLDRLARAGIVFENAGSAAPLTLPAHASILTGTYPLHHGIRDNGGYHLGEENVTLAETLASHGYRTGAFVGAFVLDSRWGLDQGFERYFDDFDFASFDDVSLGSVSRPGDEVVAEALRFLNEAKAGPFFAWIHLYDPHAPYDPPEPYRGRHGQGRFGLYDGEVAHTDELVGRLLAWLSRESLEEETVVLMIGDHGESLEEHGELDHGFFLYDATMKVPFIIRAPALGRGNVRVQAQVRAIDLMPTVLELVGLEVPRSVQGVSLAPSRSEGKRIAFSRVVRRVALPSQSLRLERAPIPPEARRFISSKLPRRSSTISAPIRWRPETSLPSGPTPSPSSEPGSKARFSGSLSALSSRKSRRRSTRRRERS